MSEPVARVSANNTPAPPESGPPAQLTLDEGGDDAGVIVPKELTDDDESALGSSNSSSTTSVTSSVLDYRLDNGRTYHAYKNGKYLIPNDERELDRLDLEHNMFLRTFGNRLGTAPPNEENSNVGRVLDAGTGTGIWAIDFGDEHPDAEAIGVDLSATWPDYNLAPGGYLEMNEVDLFPQSDDGTLNDDSAILESTRLLHEFSTIFGRSPLKLEDLTKTMTSVGFEDVTVQKFKWPTNSWPKDAHYKEWEEVIVFMVDVRKEFANKQIHAYFSVWSVYGRKPSTPKSPAVA
ncbi:methyltransferase domain-containing protein [Colletotrichum tabaci]|uniref:Methyltransferase domain-containing protein n=1 Tax=Colletotrichum tabaci TaxID=1209068 RepID=A0AAV9SX51_9PEZI